MSQLPDAHPAPGSQVAPKIATPLGRSGRSRIGSAPRVKILATGSYVPDQVVTNEDLAALGCDSEWIVRRTGILQRRKAADDQATSDLALAAAQRCLTKAEVTPEELDLILVATITPDHPTPSTACHLQRQLGAIAPAMDINAACAGFMYAMVTAAQFVSSGAARRALVIGADLMSRTIDPDDKKTYPLFGDAAGAALLGPDDADENPAGLLAFTLGSEGCGGEMLCIPAGGSRQELNPAAWQAGGQYLRMDGRGVFKWAVRTVADSTHDLLDAANLQPSDLDLLILHQANQRIIDSAVNDLEVDRSRVFVNLDRYGNTSAASIPLALDEALEKRCVTRGQHLLLSGFGAGLAWGSALLRF